VPETPFTPASFLMQELATETCARNLPVWMWL